MTKQFGLQVSLRVYEHAAGHKLMQVSNSADKRAWNQIFVPVRGATWWRFSEQVEEAVRR